MSRNVKALEKDHSERDAENIIQRGGPELGMPTGIERVGHLRNGGHHKA
jgi:hypothetical protein